MYGTPSNPSLSIRIHQTISLTTRLISYSQTFSTSPSLHPPQATLSACITVSSPTPPTPQSSASSPTFQISQHKQQFIKFFSSNKVRETVRARKEFIRENLTYLSPPTVLVMYHIILHRHNPNNSLSPLLTHRPLSSYLFVPDLFIPPTFSFPSQH